MDTFPSAYMLLCAAVMAVALVLNLWQLRNRWRTDKWAALAEKEDKDLATLEEKGDPEVATLSEKEKEAKEEKEE